jgi:hypothetical protein
MEKLRDKRKARVMLVNEFLPFGNEFHQGTSVNGIPTYSNLEKIRNMTNSESASPSCWAVGEPV